MGKKDKSRKAATKLMSKKTVIAGRTTGRASRFYEEVERKDVKGGIFGRSIETGRYYKQVIRNSN